MDSGSVIPAAKRLEVDGARRESPFASSNGRTRSYQEDAAVSPDLRSRLESIGMRTRFNVGRGYGSPPPSHFNDHIDLQGGSNGVFASANQVLHSVRSTKGTWNRTKSAPLYDNELVPFCGIRADLIEQDENQDPNEDKLRLMTSEQEPMEEKEGAMQGIGLGDLKRNRDDVFGDWADEPEDHALGGGAAATAAAGMDIDTTTFNSKPIAALPQRGNPSTSAFTPGRGGAHTLPISAGLSTYLASAQDIDWSSQDFSAFTNKTDF